jgi:O-antigen/teichoic acid export membrane protein
LTLPKKLEAFLPLQGATRQAVAALKALAGIGATLAAVQGLSFLANILVVRALTVADYAILTSSLSILGVLTAIADSGLSQAAMTVGGAHHGDVREKAQVLRRCRQLILRTGSVALLVIVPVWFVMVERLGGGSWEMVGVALLLFGGFFATLGFNIFKSFLLLEGRRVMLQKVEVVKTVVRVGLLAAGLWFLPNVAFVVACATIVEFGAWWFSRQYLRHLLLVPDAPSTEIRREVSAIFWRLMPATLYKATSSQVFLLLLVGFGTVGSVAGAGVLGRFHQFYMIVGSVVVTIFFPRLARTTGAGPRTRKLLMFTAVGWLASLAVCVALVVFASPILGWFGEEYSGLTAELRIFVSASCMYSMAGVLMGLLNTRGWVVPPSLLIGGDLISTILAIIVCDVSTLWGFTIMTCIVHGAYLLLAVNWAVFCLATRRHEEAIV